MEKAIADVTRLLEIDEKSPWSHDVKASDEVLDRIFKLFFKELGLPILFRKSEYHTLTYFLSQEEIVPEISEKLDAIAAMAKRARPLGDNQ